MIARLPGTSIRFVGRVRARGAIGIATAVALSAIALSSAVRSETPLDVRASGNGVGIFVDGRLACWLTLQAGKLRGNVAFVLTRDGLSCSIVPQADASHRRHMIARIEQPSRIRPVSHDRTKCFLFDGRQFCE